MGTTPLITSLRLIRPAHSLQFFKLASPPRIHMDSWWAAKNPKQGLKWTHNIAQNQSGAYRPEPCRIWASKLLELVFYLSWLNEPAEPAEPDANWSNRWKQILKFWQNVPSRVRNPLKKWCMIPSSEEGDMIKTITKNQCSTPADLMNWLNRLNRLPTSRPVAKNFENFTECSWKNKESIKRNGSWFRVWMREIQSKQARVLRTSTCPYKPQLS